MAELKQYLSVLAEGLQKKNRILNKILQLNAEQANVIKKESLMQEFDALVEEKGKWIEELNRVDQGFQSVYNRIRRELSEQKDMYKAEIATLQKLIQEMTDLSVKIETTEQKNKLAVEQYFRNQRQAIGNNKKSLKAANDYYKSMSRVNYVDPQLMDQKK
ncbi:MAG: hypothetical protein IKB01_00235 [Lachnospiraceae bacterium]|nr:hypothetical protein [Lachnospiraceae bacterium]